MISLKPKFQIPPTRLPFVNGQIAQILVDGHPYLVSAVWGAAAGGQLYFWNPETRKQFMRPLPNGSPGAYFLATAVDNRLYIGDGNGDLHRYDPANNQIQTLVKGQMHDITWGGCVTDRYVVWSATPDACVYDWRNDRFVKKFSSVDSTMPHSLYAHNVIEAPDGKVLLFMDVPQAKIVELDLANMRTRSIGPKTFDGGGTTAAGFINPHTLLAFNGGQVLAYPSYELIARIPSQHGVSLGHYRGTFLNGFYYVVANHPVGALARFDFANRQWEILDENWTDGETAYLGTYIPGKTRHSAAVIGITTRGMALCYEPASGRTTRMQIDNLGVMPAFTMAVGAEANLIIGAPFINTSFWTIDMQTGQGQDRGRAMPGAGEVCQIIWDAGRHRAVMSSYTHAAITEYDPSHDGHWPINPRLVASAYAEHQMRPLDFQFDRHFFWMATSPDYGQLGGALSRINPDTGEIKVWRNIIPEQTVNALALDLKKHRVYFSTSIYGDQNSCPPTQKSCELVAFDMIQLRIIRRHPLPNVPTAGIICLLPDGRVLLHVDLDHFAWNPDTNQLKLLGQLPSRTNSITQEPNGTLWAAVAEQVGRVAVVDDQIRFTPVINMPGKFLQIVEGTMYWATGEEIYAMAI